MLKKYGIEYFTFEKANEDQVIRFFHVNQKINQELKNIFNVKLQEPKYSCYNSSHFSNFFYNPNMDKEIFCKNKWIDCSNINSRISSLHLPTENTALGTINFN
ncbi:uncharacterized protein VNE69_02227 [Vairimorpha necatrix]|uniref:Uncharacterized protein n=1 Tax=Vairimorpha necatrix TaxID=6039 RepID=A0AAX4J9V1_9MICR